jgi:hypothetical protein
MRPKVKKIILYMIFSLFLFTNVSCAQAKDEPSSGKLVAQGSKSPAGSELVSPQHENDNELVYLKVLNAVASGFDETPEWAPKPDAMAVADRSLETRWASGYKDGEWVYIDFGKPKTISKVVIKWEQAYAPNYEVLTSDDAKTWKRLVLMEGQTGGRSEIGFQPVTCRYVKLVGLTRVNPEWGISVWEFEAYGPADKNPGDFANVAAVTKKEKTAEEKKLEEIRLVTNPIVPSPGAITANEFQRGVNYTSWSTDELNTDMSDYSLIHLSELGVGHVALMAVHYQVNPESKVISADEKKTTSDESIGHAINIIHALGMKVMLKPHVDLVDEEARTNIIPSDDWFVSYKNFILHYAELAAKYNVELLCIGTELSNTTTSKWKDKWTGIIKDIRKVYKGPLTYAANWDEYETVSFWPEVDYIGMDAYFPLTKENNPPLQALIKAWEGQAAILEKWLKDNNLNKPIIFTEVGYDTIEGSNRQPWRVLPTLATRKESQDEQANCLSALLEVMTQKSWFKGFYWWNYFPRPDIGAFGYTLRDKKGEKILSEWYKRLK